MDISDQSPDNESLAERLAGCLARYLGPYNARVAVKTFAKKTFDCEPERLRPEQLPQLLEALAPMLRTLVGHQAAAAALKTMEKELLS